MRPSSRLWATVLAGGSGRRLSGVTGGVPKQFCAFGGARPLLADTLDRIAPLVPHARISIVVDRSHQPYLEALKYPESARVLYQPCDRGTGAGVLFGMLPAMDSGRDPIVLLTPSDHGVLDRPLFRSSIREAVAGVGSGRQGVVLFGAEPSEADGDYGWISPDPVPDDTGGVQSGFRGVASFVEKPPPRIALKLFEGRAVWNTMVVVARLSILLDLYRRHLPDVIEILARAQQMSLSARAEFLEQHYRCLAVTDFCRDVLMRASGLWVCIWPTTLGWSDLGTPERLRRWMTTAGQNERNGNGRVRTGGPHVTVLGIQMEGRS